MKSDERKKVRPVAQTSIADKVFKPVVLVAKKVRLQKEQPSVVLADLRRGSLTSLDRYLAKHGGIAHRAIAVELRKLISGSASRAKFRLLVVEHPGRKSKGGAPRKGDRAPTAKEREIAELYASLAHVPRDAAVFDVAKVTQKSESAVRKAIGLVEEYDKRVAIEANRQIARDHSLNRREAALQSLRAATQDTD